MMKKVPTGQLSPLVVIDDDTSGSCAGCKYLLALRYLLEHGTGTGRLILSADELAEMGETAISALVVQLDKH